MSNFSVGEVAIFYRPGSEYHGSEVTIAGPLRYAVFNDCRTGRKAAGLCHSIEGPFQPKFKHASGRPVIFVARIKHLRKRPGEQDQNEVIRWESCPWSPQGVTA